MNAQNFLYTYIGKLYRYDREPKYFTKKMIIQLMEDYYKHRVGLEIELKCSNCFKEKK